MIFEMTKCEKKLGYSFKDKMLLRKCFTHSSYAHESGEDSNEILEFFGDAVIQFIVTEQLVVRRNGQDEGDLTAQRQKLVSREPLQKAVERLGVTEYLLIGNGLINHVSKNDKMYSSLYEAIVAGIYIDGGLEEAKKFILRTLFVCEKEGKKAKQTKQNTKDSKTLLQEYVQKNKIGKISYKQVYKKGFDHKPTFGVELLIDGKVIAKGEGAKKQLAEMQAAEKGLKILKKNKSKKVNK